jgi:hypothetical protein
MDREIDSSDRHDLLPPERVSSPEKQSVPPGKNGHASARQRSPNEGQEQQTANRRIQPESPTAMIQDSNRQRRAGRPRERTVISPDARETMKEIGRFRTLAVADLAHHKYSSDASKMRQDLRSLIAHGLIQRRTIWAGKREGRVEFVALTRQGKGLLEIESKATGQRFYNRFVKPKELLHDAAIYRMYHAERDRIEKAGGRISRVVLDYELKQNAYSPLAKAKGLPALDYARRQEEIARENGLKVVQGHITLPDLRIEYQTADGEAAHLDLELATEHYRGSHMASKAEAGFKMYAAGTDAARLSRVLEEREITAEILSL